MTRWALFAFALVALAPACKHTQRVETEAHAEAAIRWDVDTFTEETRGPVERVTVVEEWADPGPDPAPDAGPPVRPPDSPQARRPTRVTTTTEHIGPVVRSASTVGTADIHAQLDREVSDFEEVDSGVALGFWLKAAAVALAIGLALAAYRVWRARVP